MYMRMCIKHHTHCSVESVTERGTGAPSLSSCVEQVDGLSKPEQRNVSAQGITHNRAELFQKFAS